MNVRRRTGIMGPGIGGTKVKTDVTPALGTHGGANHAQTIQNAVAMRPKSGTSQLKKIKGSIGTPG